MLQLPLTFRRRQAFTLIESLAVIAIIGILMTVTTYAATQAKRQARDAKRKNDLYAISQGFEARALDKTCPDSADIGFYPGLGVGARLKWVKVSKLSDDTSCNGFSQYLSTIPSDPQSTSYDYYFNLATGSQSAKHYRLAASLERLTDSDQTSCLHDSSIWTSTYGGSKYDCVDTSAISNASITDERPYLFYLGR